MKNILLVTGFLIVSLGASIVHANTITCTNKDFEFSVDTQTQMATVRSSTGEAQFKLTHGVWDGHAAGLITGEGFAFAYSNWYGCYKQVTAIFRKPGPKWLGNLQQTHFAACNGGSTPDSLCNGGN